MNTLTIIGTNGIIALAVVYLALVIPAVYVTAKNEQPPFLLPWILLIVLIPVISHIVYMATYFTRKKHKSQFETMLVEESEEKSTQRQSKQTPAGVPEDTASHILSYLDTFEKKKEYLKPSITLSGLAKDFNVSSRHLSKALTFYKKKRFYAYINTLRIDYLVEKIRSGDDLRKYTSKAAARELGFSSTTAFSLAFLRRTGMYHYPFVEQFTTDEEEQWAF